jgi:nucleotide-binding universal stress UspA family protein
MGTIGPATLSDVTGTPFPYRDFLVARTYDPRADAAATKVARKLAERIRGVPVIRAEAETLERQARYAALAIVGSPADRRSAAMPGGDPFKLARRLRVPVVVVPARLDHDPSGPRSMVCGVRDRADAPTVMAAAALADALDLQLVLLHVCEHVNLGAIAVHPMPAGASEATTTYDRAAARSLLGAVASYAGRSRPGDACLRVREGPAGDGLCRAGGDERAALIALSAPRHGRVVSTLLGSAARHVTGHSDRPVLICPRVPDPALGLDVS